MKGNKNAITESRKKRKRKEERMKQRERERGKGKGREKGRSTNHRVDVIEASPIEPRSGLSASRIHATYVWRVGLTGVNGATGAGAGAEAGGRGAGIGRAGVAEAGVEGAERVEGKIIVHGMGGRLLLLLR